MGRFGRRIGKQDTLYMINSIGELKELVLWAKSNGLKRLKVGSVEIEFSDIEMSMRLMSPSEADSATQADLKSGNEKELSDDELLFMSAR